MRLTEEQQEKILIDKINEEWRLIIKKIKNEARVFDGWLTAEDAKAFLGIIDKIVEEEGK